MASSNSSSPGSKSTGPSVVLVGNDLNTLLTAYYLLCPTVNVRNQNRSASADLCGACSVTVLTSNRRLNFHWADESVFSYWSSLMNKWRLSSSLLSHHRMKATPSNTKFLFNVDAQAAIQHRHALMKHSFQQLSALQSNSLFPFLKTALSNSQTSGAAPFHHMFTDKLHVLRELEAERQQFKQATDNELTVVHEKDMEYAPELKRHAYLFSAVGRTQNDILLPMAFTNTLLAQCQQKKFDVVLNAKVKSLEWSAVSANANANANSAQSVPQQQQTYHVTALHSSQGTFKADAFVVQDSEAMVRLLGIPKRHLLLQRIVGMNVSKPLSAVRPVQFQHEGLFVIPDEQRLSVSIIRHYFAPDALLASSSPSSSPSSFWSSVQRLSASASAPVSDPRVADVFDGKQLIEGVHSLYKDFQPAALSPSEVSVRWEAVVDDLLPIVGRVKPFANVYVNTGMTFFGAAALPACAQWTAQMILQGSATPDTANEEEKRLIAALSPDRLGFPATPQPLRKEVSPVVIEAKHSD